jgi:hypothetical protein
MIATRASVGLTNEVAQEVVESAASAENAARVKHLLMSARCNFTGAAILLVALGSSAFGGCAKDPTTIFTEVGIDQTVPPLLILRSHVVSTTDATKVSGTEQTSPAIGDAADRPGPFGFPLVLSLTVDASLAGPVTVTVEGLDWDSFAVVATGSTSAEVRAQQATRATLTLTATAPPPGDGGNDAGSDGP